MLGFNIVTITWRTSGMSDGSDDTLIPQVEYGVLVNFANTYEHQLFEEIFPRNVS